MTTRTYALGRSRMYSVLFCSVLPLVRSFKIKIGYIGYSVLFSLSGLTAIAGAGSLPFYQHKRAVLCTPTRALVGIQDRELALGLALERYFIKSLCTRLLGSCIASQTLLNGVTCTVTCYMYSQHYDFPTAGLAQSTLRPHSQQYDHSINNTATQSPRCLAA